MSELTDDILEKAVTGKVSTNSDLSPREESVASRSDRFPTGVRRRLFSAPGSLRFVGNILAGGVNVPALRSAAAPDSHPRRVQRLVQQHLFYGADVVSEGTGGNTIVGTPNQFDAGGVSVQTAITNTGYTATDLLLVFRNPLLNTASIFEITAVAGDLIDVANEDNLPTLGEQEWAVIKPNPLELLPYNDDQGGDPTAYFAIKPPKWPTREVDVAGMTLVSYSVVDERVIMSLTHTEAGQVFSEGDFLCEQSGTSFVSGGAPTFVVVDSTLTGGGPNQEDVTVTPFYNTDISRLNLSSTVAKVKSVEDFLPYEALAETYPQSSTFPQAPFDAVRVRNIVSPSDVDVAFRNPSGAMFSPQEGGSGGIAQPGYQLTLFPANGSGGPDLTSPITNLEAAGVVVDYENGVVRLSSPATLGGVLNPNSYTDADGRAKLFATFVAENDHISPVAAQELTHRLKSAQDIEAGGNRASFRFSEGELENLDYEEGHLSPSEREKGWVFGFPSAVAEELYHRDPDGDVKGGKEEKMVVTGTLDASTTRGVNTYYQYRSDLSGFFRLGGMFYGIGADERTSRFVFRPDATGLINYDADTVMESFGTADQPEFRITNEQVFVETNTEGTFSLVTASANDTLRFVINDIPVTVTLTDSATPTAASLQTDVDAAIIAAAAALGASTGTYAVTVENDGGGDYVRILADSNLYFHDGNGHANLGLVEDTYVRSEGLRLQFGWNNAVVNEISWDRTAQNFVWNGNDIQLSDGTSLAGHETRLGTLETGYANLPALINNVVVGELAYLNSYEGPELLTTVQTSPAATTSFGVMCTDGLNVYVADGSSIDVYENEGLTFVRTISTGLTSIDDIDTNGTQIVVGEGSAAAGASFEAYAVTGGAALWTDSLDPNAGQPTSAHVSIDDDQAYIAASVASGAGGGFAMEGLGSTSGANVWTYAGATVNALVNSLLSDNSAVYVVEGDTAPQLVRLNRSTGAEEELNSIPLGTESGVLDGKLVYALEGTAGVTSFVKGDVSFSSAATTTPFAEYLFGCTDERHIYFADNDATSTVGVYDKASRLAVAHRDDLGTIAGLCTDGWRLYATDGTNVFALNTGREAKVWRRISGGHWLKQFAVPGSE